MSFNKSTIGQRLRNAIRVNAIRGNAIWNNAIWTGVQTVGTRSISFLAASAILLTSGLLKSGTVYSGLTKTTHLLVWTSLIGAGIFSWLEGSQVTANRQRFEEMNGTQKSELIRKWNRFQELPEATKEKYRQFHQQLAEEPNADELREVLQRYSDWLLNVSPTQRVAFKQGELEQRIVAVRDEHIQQFLRTIGTDDQTRLLIDDAKTLLAWQRSLGRRRRPTSEDYDQLQLMLSPKPRVLMAQLAAGNLGAQEPDSENRGDLRGQLVFNWLRDIWTPLPTDHQLKDVYDTLDDEQKKELMEVFQQSGSPNQIRQQLTRFYHQSLGIDDFWNRGNRIRPMGPPPTDREPPKDPPPEDKSGSNRPSSDPS